jgi:hypothetical protein
MGKKSKQNLAKKSAAVTSNGDGLSKAPPRILPSYLGSSKSEYQFSARETILDSRK